MEVEINPKIKNIITSYFSNVDEEVSEYIQNVLNEGRQGDFRKPIDLFECLGKKIISYLEKEIKILNLSLAQVSYFKM